MSYSLVPGACEKRRSAWYTHFLRMRLISPRCGDSGLFSDSSMSCDVRVWTRYSKLVRITCQDNIMACYEFSASNFSCPSATSDPTYGSLNFQLSACTAHTRDSVSHRHCSTLYPTERLSLMLVFPG